MPMVIRSCKSTEWLQEELEALGSVLLLLLNCQEHELFVQLDGHQPGHHGPHAAPPAQGQPPIRSIIPNHADKERIATGYPTASATESDSSPVPSSPLAFPIQILSYLYLSCAKDSISLDVLGEYSIGCIVDVTPNLPNAFEHRQAQPHL
ncbi:Dual specificity protein phosphatase 7 [Camelus dromedarius]|uniref:Dual specificity protein phosphatase 7 n=1 Tax=Camelus dromedarius TaxID=9838 RepID=A0A5N4CXQ2_CAMDR|nr:Dual specificity protein phosphatase 7 [Camelus dromedarius]